MEVTKKKRNRDKASFNTSGILAPSRRVCVQCSSQYSGTGNSKYCSGACSDLDRYEAKMYDYKFRLHRLLQMAKHRAIAKGLEFNLEDSYLQELWESNLGYCELSGIKFELGRSEKGKVHPYAPSIDKIIPSLGYTKGNVRIVCYQINVALSEFGLEQFEELVQRFNEHRAAIGGMPFR